jgi:NitT/TauT family transport system substrate-binding protein
VYDAGLYAVDDVLADKNDIAVATEFILVGKALQQEKISGFGSIARYQIHYLIGRKDHGIANVSDLKGKKIGFAGGTSGEFYLSRFLELHSINQADFIPVDVRPSQYVDAIGNGTVDAILAWDPYVDTIRDQLGPNAVVWPGQSGQQGYWNAICKDDWAAQHPETITRFLESIDQAATYTIYHPAEAKAIVQKRSGAEDEYIATTWANMEFSLSLDQSLITAMEDESRWMIKNNLTATKNNPDFYDYIYRGGMDAVKPESVNVISVK